MSTRSRRRDSRRFGGGSSEIPVYVALVLIASGAVGLAAMALSGVHIGSQPTTSATLDSISTPSEVLTPAPTPTAESSPSTVGLLGSGSDSWWASSVGSGLVPGVSPGPHVGTDGMTVAEIASQVDQVVTSEGQPVVVQVGTQDIIEGATAAEIDASIKSLWQEVSDRGGRPIAALIPPSNAFPGSVVTVNNQIRTSAQDQGIAVLDLTTPVAAADGAWGPGFSDDGQRPNALGISAMAEAVSGQLPSLLGALPAAT